MNKDLENVVELIGKKMLVKSFSTKIDDIIRYYLMYEQQEKIDSLVMYKKYNIAEIIELIRIERLFDLGLITELEKNNLIEEYKEYKKLCSIIGDFYLEQISGKTSNEKKLDESIYIRKEELKSKLVSFGILDDFNFDVAIINEVDNTLKRIKK